MNKIRLEKIKDLKLLCNFENGAVVLVDQNNIEAVQTFVQTKDKLALPEEIRTYLEKSGFFELSVEGSRQAYVHITDRCNMNCVGCYSRSDNRNKIKDMDIDSIKRIFIELKDHGYKKVVISGGEPLLRNDLADVLRYAKQCNFEVVMITNGSILIENEIFDVIDNIAFSVDTFENQYNTLNRKICKDMLLKNIENARKRNVSYNGIITINRLNIGNVSRYFEFSEEYDIPISFSIFYSKDTEANRYLLKDEQLHDLADSSFEAMGALVEGFSSFNEIFCREHCGAGEDNISVDASGKLAPCHMMLDVSLGNLITNPAQAWENLQGFRNTFSVSEECKNCDYSAFCGGGCRARVKTEHEIVHKDPYCEMYRTYYEKQYEFIKQLIAT